MPLKFIEEESEGKGRGGERREGKGREGKGRGGEGRGGNVVAFSSLSILTFFSYILMFK
jgi:hypothetical protein